MLPDNNTIIPVLRSSINAGLYTGTEITPYSAKA